MSAEPSDEFNVDLRRWDGTITDAERAEAEAEIDAERQAGWQALIDAELKEQEGPAERASKPDDSNVPEPPPATPVGRVRELPRQVVRPRLAYGAIETMGPDGKWVDAAHELAVAFAVEQLRVRDEARRLYAAEAMPPQPFDAGTLADILARGPEPEPRIECFLPWEAGLLLIAPKKTGKSTISNCMARSLITGEKFLGKFKVRPIAPDAKVAILNYELSAKTFAKWAKEAGIPADRLFVVNLRGKRNPFSNEDDLARLGALLREQKVEAIIIDPFGKAFTGVSQDNNSEVGPWLDRLDQWAREVVGALDVIVTAHAGKSGVGFRGASAAEGWADVNVYLTRKSDAPGAQRFLALEGRDVAMDATPLIYDPVTRQLTLSATSAATAQNIEVLDRIVRFLSDLGTSTTQNTMEKAMKDFYNAHAVREALNYGASIGKLTVNPGPNRTKNWTLVMTPGSADGSGKGNV